MTQSQSGERTICTWVLNPIQWVAVSAMLALLAGCGGDTDPPKGVPAREETRAQVKQIIARHFGVAEETFRLDDPIMGETLGGGVLDLVDVVMELEETFEVTLPEAVLIGSESDSEFQAGITGQQLANLVEGEL